MAQSAAEPPLPVFVELAERGAQSIALAAAIRETLRNVLVEYKSKLVER